MVEKSSLTSLLSADRPIDDLEEDRLRRKDFAKNIARIFGEWKGRDSLVVALYGPWGAGKTSLKNLILKSLAENRSQGPKATEVLEFNPWQWSGHSELTSAFFGEVERAIGRTVGSKSAVRTMQILRAYAAFLGASRAVLEGVPKLVASTILLIGALGFGASISQGLAEVGPVIGAVIFGALTVAGILGLSEAVLERAAAWVSARIAVNSKTLSEYKKDLADELRKLNRNILVIIDDIDRLTPEEIRTVFQLVKANADFPNFIYFLPFQRSLVAKALNPDNAAEGDQFLEKIVQIGFDIPGVGQADIDGILEEKLNVLFAPEMSTNRFNKERWINLQQTGLRHYFPDLRRVNRFAGSLAFHVELLKRQNTLEVNPIDLIGVEVLRLFEPATYHRLRGAKYLLLESGSLSKDSENELKRQIGLLVSDANSPSSAAQILQVLFPNRRSAFGDGNYDLENRPEWTADLQICTREFYDRYFQLSIPDTDISQAEAVELTRIGDARELIARLRSYSKQNKLRAALDRFEGNVEKIPLENAPAIVTTLLEIGEDLPEEEPGFFSIGPEWSLQRTIRKLLEREPDKRRRAEIARMAITAANALSMTVIFVSGQVKAITEKKTERILFDETDIKALRDLCVTRIHEFANSGTLAAQRELAHLLFRWAEWTSDAEVQTWIAALLDTTDGPLQLLKRFTQRSVSTTGGAAVRITWFIRLEQLGRFANLEKLKARAEGIVVDEQDVEGRRALEAFHAAIARKAKGKADDDFSDD